MNIYQIIGLIAVFAITITHLIFLLLNKEKQTVFTKSFVITSVIIFAIISKETNPLIYIGLVLILVADLLLMVYKNNIFFIISICALLITNVLNFVITSANLPPRFNICYYGIIILMGYLLVESFRPLAKKKMKKFSYLCLTNLYSIVALFINALILVISEFNIYYLLIAIGSLLILTSINLLVVNRMVKKIKKADFLISLFGMVGQILVFTSLILSF